MASDRIVYVIDDDDGARDSLVFLLYCAGVRTRCFESADAFLKASPPLEGACVVTDLRMPGTSGIELAETLKTRGAAIPVIMISGHVDAALAIKAKKAGVTDFIEKPFDKEIMLSAIRRALT